MRRVHLCLGHTGSTDSEGGRPGAAHEAPGWGTFDEVEIVRAYAMCAASILELHGVGVEIDGVGSYRSRQRRASQSGALAYVDCHVNKGWRETWPVRGAVFHTPHALGGTRLAKELAGALAPVVGGAKVWETSPDDWRRNAHSNLVSTGRAPAVVYEPAFLDCPDHWHVLNDPRQIGRALASGLLAFLG